MSNREIYLGPDNASGLGYYGVIKSLTEHQISIQKEIEPSQEDKVANMEERAIAKLLTDGTFTHYDDLENFLKDLQVHGQSLSPEVKNWINDLKDTMDNFVYGYQAEYDAAKKAYIQARNSNLHIHIGHKAAAFRKYEDDRDNDARSMLTIAANSGNATGASAACEKHQIDSAGTSLDLLLTNLNQVFKETSPYPSAAMLG